MAHQVPVGWPQEAKHATHTSNSTAKTTVVAGVAGSRIPGFRWDDDDGLFALPAGASLVLKAESTTLTHYSVTYWQHP